ncbi:polymorphic toxin-type HINT domain-containing protein [Saccharibacillus alkalitolerans]|uniref:polymorphic toxin-type HINT domain-containing protein n=1 Tax=Saccharibacillus alkalitolerans TaxID=2705290 RepID=UPI001F2434B8|nr:polymorphic toxin-type HINT domain-containing protein [Saccharibacillus alkalitolerans]
MSFAADSLPFVGTFKWIQEVFTGVDMITGQQMSVTDRVATGVGTVASVIPFGKHVGKYVAKEGIEGGAWLARKLGKESDSLTSRLAKGCNCFTAGTQVKTDQGDKNIEDIQVGDKVLSQDDVTGEEGYKTVTATFNHMADEIYTIHVGDQEIESTYNHPFWVEGKGWTYVKDLKVGDWLEQADGTKLKIEQIEREQRQARVYNMTVDEFHTHFVSDLSIWVHNTNDKACALGAIKNNKKVDFRTGVGYDAGDNPVRIEGPWSINDLKQALLGHPPRGIGSPNIHHGGQMPGAAKHEIVPSEHLNNPAIHPNKYNQGVTPEMRALDRELHWWYRAREQGADIILPGWIYNK